jgi:geranylgeranyl diphosphate synthase type II
VKNRIAQMSKTTMARATDTDLAAMLRKKAQLVNYVLQQLVDRYPAEGTIKDALHYTLFAGGKKVRSALVLWCCDLVGGRINRNAEVAAAAIEMVHTYSLVHDDLPAMDNDDMRRGRATCHKAFGEATAILTGDALLTLVFEILAKEIDKPNIAVRLIAQLAQDAGPCGMIAGQMADLKAERSIGTEDVLEHIHVNKTAKMFRCAAVMGAVCGGAKKKEIDLLSEYGLAIGLGFQVADDILDVSASSDRLGKTAGKDAKARKCTYPAVVGIARAKKRQSELANQAVAALEPFGKRAQTLRQLAVALLERTC